MPNDDLLTSQQAGALINRSARTVHRHVMAGDITPAIKLAGPNGAMLFLRSDVEALAKRLAEKRAA